MPYLLWWVWGKQGALISLTGHLCGVHSCTHCEEKLHPLFIKYSISAQYYVHTSIRACFLFFFYNPYMSLFNSKNLSITCIVATCRSVLAAVWLADSSLFSQRGLRPGLLVPLEMIFIIQCVSVFFFYFWQYNPYYTHLTLTVHVSHTPTLYTYPLHSWYWLMPFRVWDGRTTGKSLMWSMGTAL